MTHALIGYTTYVFFFCKSQNLTDFGSLFGKKKKKTRRKITGIDYHYLPSLASLDPSNPQHYHRPFWYFGTLTLSCFVENRLRYAGLKTKAGEGRGVGLKSAMTLKQKVNSKKRSGPPIIFPSPP